jgi:hypothetical protein
MTEPVAPVTPEPVVAPQLTAIPEPKIDTPPGETPPVEPPVQEEAPVIEPFSLEKLTLPENFTMPEETGKEFADLINKDMPASEKAQALLDLHAKTVLASQDSIVKQYNETTMQKWNETRDAWVETAKADPDFGGTKFDTSLGGISQLIDKYGDAAAREAFDVTGAGDHPAIFKFLARIAADLGEGTPTVGDPPVPGERAPGSRIFTTMTGAS